MKEKKSQRGEQGVIKCQSMGREEGVGKKKKEADRGCGAPWRVRGVKELWFILMSLPFHTISPTPSTPPPPSRPLQQLFNMKIDLNRGRAICSRTCGQVPRVSRG